MATNEQGKSGQGSGGKSGSQQGGSGDFANDRDKASEAGKKGGSSKGGSGIKDDGQESGGRSDRSQKR